MHAFESIRRVSAAGTLSYCWDREPGWEQVHKIHWAHTRTARYIITGLIKRKMNNAGLEIRYTRTLVRSLAHCRLRDCDLHEALEFHLMYNSQRRALSLSLPGLCSLSCVRSRQRACCGRDLCSRDCSHQVEHRRLLSYDAPVQGAAHSPELHPGTEVGSSGRK